MKSSYGQSNNNEILTVYILLITITNYILTLRPLGINVINNERFMLMIAWKKFKEK